MRGLRPLLLAVVLGCLVPGAAWGASSPVLSGSVSNNTDLSATVSVAVSGHYAYTTAYQAGELTAVDISNPAAPVVAGNTGVTNDLYGGSNVAISGGYAFVVSKNRNASTSSNDDGTGNSLTIVDIHTDPANPSVVGTVRSSTELFGAYGIAVSGNFAYVAYQGLLGGQPSSPDTSTGGFSVIDISTLGAPTIVANIDNGSLSAPYTNAFDHSTSVQISGHYAYVTAFNAANFTVVDISNPSSPQIVAMYHDATNMAFPVDIALAGTYAYVADQVGGTSDELTVLDISNPSSPRLAGTLSDAALNGAYRIRVRGDFAYESGSSANTIAAIDISNPTAPRVAGFYYDATNLHRTTGLDLDAAGTHVVASSPYLPSETNQTYPPFTSNHGTISVITLDPAPISVAITPASEPANPTTSTSASFAFSVNDTVSAVQCQLDGGGFGACTSSTTQTYSGLSVGSHTFTVEAIDSTGHTVTGAYTWTVGTVPSNSGAAPSISGSTAVGSTLNAATGGWSGSPTPSFAYQWNQCDATGANCAPITGQTASSYVIQSADAGHKLTVSVTGANSLGSSTVSSSPIGPAGSAPSNSGATPSISGSPVAGSTLTAVNGGWSGAPAPTFTYQWEQCSASGTGCAAIGGAIGPAYAVQSSDAGHELTVVVTGANLLGSASATATATAVGPVPNPPGVTGAPPSISGMTLVGQTLTAAPGTWSGTPAFSYQWLRCAATGGGCSTIGGASGQTYTLVTADAGHTLQVLVTGTNASGSGSASSSATAVVQAPPVNTTAPAITGTALAGQTLTAASGTWSGYPAPAYAYQWRQCSATATGCAAITGATGSTYLARAGDAGHALVVAVTASNAAGAATATSAATPAVAAAPSNTRAPSISGTAAVGQTLTASNGSWSGYPTPSLSDQWMRCNSVGESCAAIAGATAATYKVTSADVSHALRLYVRATNSAGSALARSGYTGVVPPGTSVAAGGVGAGRPHLKLSVQAGSSGAAVSQVTISLPPGLAFAGRHLAGAIRVSGPGGRHVSYRVAVRQGAVVISLRAAQSGLTITVAAAGLTVTPRLRTQVRRHPGTRVSLRLVVKIASGQLSRQTATFKLS